MIVHGLYLDSLLLLTERDLPESNNTLEIWRLGMRHELVVEKCERLKLLLMMF